VRRRSHRSRPSPSGALAVALHFAGFALLPLAAQSPPASPPASPSGAAIASPLESLFAAALEDAARRGIPAETIALRIDLPDGATFGHRGDVPQAPASTLKILTAVVALDLLGPDHPLATELWLAGEVRAGSLEGDLIVVGGGDPATSSRRFPDDPVAELRPWVDALRSRGIRRISGDLVAEIGYLAGPSRIEEWPREQLHRWYCAPSGALNLNDNCIDVRIAPRGERIEVSLRPENPLYSVENVLRPTTERGRHLYSVDRAPDSWRIRVSGRFLASAPARTEWITAPDPALSFLGAWRALLRAEGIEVAGELRVGAREPGAVRVARIEHRVADTLGVLLKNSQNLYGDCLLRVANREEGGDGSFAGAGATALSHLAKLGGGSGAVVRDGSGLSSRNRLCCSDLVRILRHADRASWRETFWQALPLAGVDGTLEKRFRGGALAGRLRGKTGHLDGVTALAGGWESAAGPVRFASLTGGRGAKVGAFREWLDALLVGIDASISRTVPSPRPAAGSPGL